MIAEVDVAAILVDSDSKGFHHTGNLVARSVNAKIVLVVQVTSAITRTGVGDLLLVWMDHELCHQFHF